MTAEAPGANPFPPGKIFSAEQLLAWQPPKMDWLIPGLLPGSGLGLMVGQKKCGKSWLSLQVARAVAQGASLLTYGEATKAVVLYAALEDGSRRLRSRLEKQGGVTPDAAQHLHFATSIERMPGALDHIERLHQKLQFRLLIVDVWQRIAEPAGRGDQYSAIYSSLGGLKQQADRCGFFLMCVHHSRKSGGESLDPDADWVDSILGSSALAGVADVLCLLKRKRNSTEAKLFTTSRDFSEGLIDLSFDEATCTFAPASDGAGLNALERMRQNDTIDRRAKVWLAGKLAEGRQPVRILLSEGAELGFNESCLRRVKNAMGVASVTGATGQRTWEMERPTEAPIIDAKNE